MLKSVLCFGLHYCGTGFSIAVGQGFCITVEQGFALLWNRVAFLWDIYALLQCRLHCCMGLDQYITGSYFCSIMLQNSFHGCRKFFVAAVQHLITGEQGCVK